MKACGHLHDHAVGGRAVATVTNSQCGFVIAACDGFGLGQNDVCLRSVHAGHQATHGKNFQFVVHRNTFINHEFQFGSIYLCFDTKVNGTTITGVVQRTRTIARQVGRNAAVGCVLFIGQVTRVCKP